MALFETEGAPRVRTLDARLPADPDWRRDQERPAPQDWQTYFEQQRPVEDGVVPDRLAVLSRLLHEGLRATPQMLLQRAGQAQSRLAALNAVAITPPDDAGPAQLHRLSAVLLASAVGQPERQRQLAVQRIADAARFVLCRRQVPGSRWSSRRHLDFLTHDATWRLLS